MIFRKCKNTADEPAKLIEELGLNNGNGQAHTTPPPAPHPEETE